MEAPDTHYAPLPKSKLFNDYTGREFGFWKVLGYLGVRKRNQIWRCRCVCGNVKAVHGGSLQQKTSTNCGCKSIEKTIIRNTTHGRSKTSEYKILQQIILRCTSPKVISWRYYGAMGIGVCKRWTDGEDGKTGFECFYEDMGPRPHGLTIHRVDGSGNYCKENCVWATWITQNNESAHNHVISWRGKSQSLADWAREMNLTRGALKDRVRRGWDLDRAMTAPMRSWPKPKTAA